MAAEMANLPLQRYLRRGWLLSLVLQCICGLVYDLILYYIIVSF